MNDQNITSRRFCSSGISILLVTLLLKLCQVTSAAENLKNETDRLSLLEFKNQISDDPNGVLKLWNDSQHHCQWPGVICGSRHQRVTGLYLSTLSLLGSISPHIGNLSFLRLIYLRHNRLYGVIPQEVGRLRQLRYIYLTNNTLEGEIPANLSNCLQLRIIETLYNRLVGKIPYELGSLKMLEGLLLGHNNLTGEIPRSIGNLTSLRTIYLTYNKLEGQLPEELGQLTSLVSLAFGVNNFSGRFPRVFNISSLAGISAPNVLLQGSLPVDIGLTMPNLQEFLIGGNQFEGTIPASFANASKLQKLDLIANNFRGQVPNDLGNLQNLTWLNIGWNSLGRNSSGDLDFLASLSNCTKLQSLLLSQNNFGGKVPNFIGNLSLGLEQLDLGLNQITGEIPTELGNLANLYLLGLDNNLFSGSIPNFFGQYRTLQKLYLANNTFSGQIPPSLFNTTSLYALHLPYNRLEGNIPPTIANCQSLQELDISYNNISGTMPSEIFSLSSLSILKLSNNSISGSLSVEIGSLKRLYWLILSYNKFSGEIPGAIGECSNLEYINMQGNFFIGAIPQQMATLKGLRVLDLSRNNLTGQIPEDLEVLRFVQFVNLSFNELDGKVPVTGFWENASIEWLAGNNKLCGGIPRLQLPSCPVEKRKNGKHLALRIIIPLVGFGLILVALFSFGIFYLTRNGKSLSVIPCLPLENFPRISYHELYKATEGFSSGNLIGLGSFGAVYKGKLHPQGEKLVAVKVLDLEKSGAIKSFAAECRALKNIRHRNLVAILTCCSSNDFQRKEFKALVYEFMSNGDLDTWLHRSSDEMSTSRTLDMVQRLNIAIDVALALDYLHNDCETPIVHNDLKPCNVLLDDDFTAHVGDFGLARLLYQSNGNPSQPLTNSLGLKGTLGYAAPEYGIGGQASTLGDVYSFGILLLELFTGRRPTDELFKDGFNLHEYVKISLPQVLNIMDPLLLASEEEDDTNTMSSQIGEEMHKCLLSIFIVGLSCSSELPRDRKNIKDAANDLNIIKQEFLREPRR